MNTPHEPLDLRGEPNAKGLRVSRRGLFNAAGVGIGALSAAAVLSACGDALSQAAGGTGDSSSGANTGVLTIGAGAGTNNQFTQNFNGFVSAGTATVPVTGLFYESLFRISTKNGGFLQPVLAEKVVYSDGGKTATYTLKKGVTWNDGTKFTSADVAYFYGRVFGPPGPDADWLIAPIETPDDHTVIIKYTTPQYQEDTNLSAYYPIQPKHIYSKYPDASKFVDKEPVGTGPGKLASFAGQRIEIDIREDYHGGPSKGVKKVVLVPAGTVGNIQSNISKGVVDWAQGGGPGVQSEFLKMDKDNQYAFWPNGSSSGILFGCRYDPFKDKFVRKALRDSIDLRLIQQAVGTGAPIPSVTGLDVSLYKEALKPEYAKSAELDIDGAKKSLADGGYTVANGKLMKDGKEVPLELTISLGQSDFVNTAPICIAQWKKHLGIDVKLTQVPDQIFQAKIATYQMCMWTTTLNGSAYNAYQGYSHSNLAEDKQKNGNGNQGRWRIPDEGNNAILTLLATPASDKGKTIEMLQILQTNVAEEAPFVSMFTGGGGVMTTTKNWEGWPEVNGETDYYPFSSSTVDGTLTIMNLTPAKK